MRWPMMFGAELGKLVVSTALLQRAARGAGV